MTVSKESQVYLIDRGGGNGFLGHFIIPIKYYLERQILPAVENIFQVFNIDIKEIIDGKKQDNLSKWM